MKVARWLARRWLTNAHVVPGYDRGSGERQATRTDYVHDHGLAVFADTLHGALDGALNHGGRERGTAPNQSLSPLHRRAKLSSPAAAATGRKTSIRVGIGSRVTIVNAAHREDHVRG